MEKITVYLVHGTWPYGLLAHHLPILRRLCRRPRWFQEGSLLWQDLEREGLQCRTFDWSGANSLLARRNAAAELRRTLEAARAEHPRDVRLVIAHSHGGNVAVEALGSPEASGLARGVVTLGTPFLHFRSRVGVRDEGVLGFAQLSGLAVLGAAILARRMPEITALAREDFIFQPSAVRRWFLVVAYIVALICFLLSLAWSRFRDGLTGHALRDPGPVPGLLILRAPRDEPTLALSAARTADWAVETAWLAAKKLLPPSRRRKGWKGRLWGEALEHAALGVVALGMPWSVVLLANLFRAGEAPWAFLREDVSRSWQEWALEGSPAHFWFSWLFRSAGFALGLASLLVLCPMGLMLVMSGIALAPFGWELAFCGLNLEVNAEASPPGGTYPIETIRPTREELDSLGFRPRHGLYEFPSVRSRLLRWAVEQG